MTVAIWDHLLALLVFVAFPIYSAITFPRVLRVIEQGGEQAKVGVYREVVFTWAVFAIVLMGLWVIEGRPLADLGFQWPDWTSLVVATVIATVVVLIIILPIRKFSQGAGPAALHEQLADLGGFLPHSKREERWFYLVSINAGITEEIIFRGYLIWYLQQYMAWGWAAAIAVVVFALAHSYQGLKQLPGFVLVSAVTVGLFIYMESLLVVVLFHIALDALQGYYIALIRRREPSNPETPNQVNDDVEHA